MITETTPLTPALRATLRDALLDLITGDTHFALGAPGYLATLNDLRDGDAIGDLADVTTLLDIDA